MKAILAAFLAVAAAAGTAGAAGAPTSAWDKQWLKTSLAGDRFEIAGGKLALARSHNPPCERSRRGSWPTTQSR